MKPPFLAWTKAVDIVFYASLFDRTLCTEAGISKNYCATNSGLPEVELRFCPWPHIVQIVNRLAWPELFSLSVLCVFLAINHRSAEAEAKTTVSHSRNLSEVCTEGTIVTTWHTIINFATLFHRAANRHAPASWWNFQLLLYSKCTQPSVMNYVTQGRHGLVLYSTLGFSLRVTQRARFVLWWTVHAAIPDGRTTCLNLELLIFELLANPAVVADVIVLNVHKKPS